jgi:hypothetical protein
MVFSSISRDSSIDLYAQSATSLSYFARLVVLVTFFWVFLVFGFAAIFFLRLMLFLITARGALYVAIMGGSAPLFLAKSAPFWRYIQQG